ncbi:hypothetical protein M9Y10_035100 [Tritrichomonas musculus]|uniref:Uncharacterized protein n=1 Tax=Tritrichomonas musculus TaxID=1915356 RepID=A0ABR2KHM0_9EUKA
MLVFLEHTSIKSSPNAFNLQAKILPSLVSNKEWLRPATTKVQIHQTQQHDYNDPFLKLNHQSQQHEPNNPYADQYHRTQQHDQKYPFLKLSHQSQDIKQNNPFADQLHQIREFYYTN